MRSRIGLTVVAAGVVAVGCGSSGGGSTSPQTVTCDPAWTTDSQADVSKLGSVVPYLPPGTATPAAGGLTLSVSTDLIGGQVGVIYAKTGLAKDFALTLSFDSFAGTTTTAYFVVALVSNSGGGPFVGMDTGLTAAGVQVSGSFQSQPGPAASGTLHASRSGGTLQAGIDSGSSHPSASGTGTGGDPYRLMLAIECGTPGGSKCTGTTSVHFSGLTVTGDGSSCFPNGFQ